MQIKDFGLGFRLEEKVVFIAIFQNPNQLPCVKTRFFTNFFSIGVKTSFSPTFPASSKLKTYILLQFLLQKKNMQIKDFGLGFRLEEKMVFIAFFKTQIGFVYNLKFGGVIFEISQHE
jgi:hypothetical protein